MSLKIANSLIQSRFQAMAMAATGRLVQNPHCADLPPAGARPRYRLDATGVRKHPYPLLLRMGLSLRRLGYVMLGQAGRQWNSSGAIWKPAFAAFLMMGEGFAMGEISHAKSLSRRLHPEDSLDDASAGTSMKATQMIEVGPASWLHVPAPKT